MELTELTDYQSAAAAAFANEVQGAAFRVYWDFPVIGPAPREAGNRAVYQAMFMTADGANEIHTEVCHYLTSGRVSVYADCQDWYVSVQADDSDPSAMLPPDVWGRCAGRVVNKMIAGLRSLDADDADADDVC